MGVIAWIVLGLIADCAAEKLVGSRHGPLTTTLISVAGALLGGWLASEFFHVADLQGFFNISTWITAVAGAFAMLASYHSATSRRTAHQVGVRR